MPADLHVYSVDMASRPDISLTLKGYAFAGEVARNSLLREIGINVPVARDADVVAVSEMNPDMSTDVLVGVNAKYMPVDSAHGHGVRRESLYNYFTSRDFNLNQVLVVA